jgi:heat shock protein HtpX
LGFAVGVAEHKSILRCNESASISFLQSPMRKTLPEQIAANKRASAIWVTLLFLFLVILGTVIVGAYEPKYLIFGAAGSALLGLILVLVATYGGSDIVLQMTGVREATIEEDRMLRNVVEEMAIASGTPMPKVYVIDDSAPNAFATGRDPNHASVAITTGLLQKLDRDELQGVMAHEMAHIKNFDIRLMTTVALVAGAIPLIADAFLRAQWYRRRSDDNDSGQLAIVFTVIGIVLSLLAPLFAMLLKMAVSRQREYLADASAADMTRNPDGLARALWKIEHDSEPLEAANRATQHMYIVNPLRLHGGDSMFSTHPPTEERIRRLQSFGANWQDPLVEAPPRVKA